MHFTHFIYGYMASAFGKGPLRLLERKPGPTSLWVIIFY